MERHEICSHARALEDKIESHPGYNALKRISALSCMHYIYKNNFEDFERHLDQFLIGENALSLQRNKDHADRQLLEAVRLLHNLLAGIKSLVENERWLIGEWYSGHPFEEEHSKKIKKQFALSDTVKFLEELRNCFLHKSYTSCAFRVDIEPDDFKARFVMYRDKVLSEYDWSGRSKQFLRSQDEEFEILSIVREYELLTMQFYDWLEDRIRSIHQLEIIEVQMLEIELHKMYRVLGHNV